VAISFSSDGQWLATCPACGYPTLGNGLCAPCTATGVSETNPVAVDGDAADFNPAA
jgi:hypothetical protein